jgi:hypothetical protein
MLEDFYLPLIFLVLVAIAAILGWIALQINEYLNERDRERSAAGKKRNSQT